MGGGGTSESEAIGAEDGRGRRMGLRSSDDVGMRARRANAALLIGLGAIVLLVLEQ